MCWVYRENEPIKGSWSVGHYIGTTIGDCWREVETFDNKDSAAERVNYLNGGMPHGLIEELSGNVYALAHQIAKQGDY